MPTQPIARPDPTEYAPFYARYVDLVPEGDLLTILKDQRRDTSRLLRGSAEHADFAYAPGKWTVKEVVGHLSDTERVMGYRAVRFARGDPTNLPGFDENAFVAGANFGRRTLDDLAEEFATVRDSTLHFVQHLDQEEASRLGSANGNAVSVRALLYIIAGHELHHGALLRDRYGL